MKLPAAVSTAHQPANLRPILDRIFRANPGYELVAYNRLPAEQQELFVNLRRDPDFYGILRPRDGASLAVKSACRDTALLFLTLQEPDALPPFVLAGDSGETNRALAMLVLDGVFEMETNGRMVHGAEAFADICEPPAAAAAISGIAAISRQALQYGQSLPLTEAAALSARLYSYGRLPLSPEWRRKYPNEDAVRRCLGVEPDGANTARLAQDWHALPPDPDNDGWIAWQSRHAPPPAEAMYKLYVSPHPDHLRAAFDVMTPALTAARAHAFKVGKDLPGVLRPDKFVAYFATLAQVRQAAGAILDQLANCPAHGVPFTAELGSPLVSWGIDPPIESDAPVWLSRQSWRLWVTNRLALALLSARQNDTQSDTQGMAPWQFAIERLRLEGVDTDTWTPIREERN